MQRLESRRGRGLACEGEVELVFAFNEKSINCNPAIELARLKSNKMQVQTSPTY